MRHDPPFVVAALIGRRQRFLADVRLAGGAIAVAHVANTGSMRSTDVPGSAVALSRAADPARKLQWTLEYVRVGRTWVGVNTARPNALVAEAIAAGRIPELAGFRSLRREVPYGERSRVDILLEDGARRCYVEVKNVTYREGRAALFPDAVTERGARHLVELMRAVGQGHRAALLFAVNRGDCAEVRPARQIDPRYAELLALAAEAGVELLARRVENRLDRSAVGRALPVRAY